MPTVTIWHNITRDASDRPVGMLDGFQPEHLLTPVARYSVETGEAVALAIEAFTTFNVGDDGDFNGQLQAYRVDLAVAYRKRKNRSLSVGDVVQVDGTWQAVGRIGWQRIESPSQLVWITVYGSTPLGSERTGYLCKRCNGASPFGIGYATSVEADAGAEHVTVCPCGYSLTPDA